MEILIQATYFILSLSFLIILHELGHYIPAKLFKIKVEKFYLFFDAGFSLFKIKRGETEYGIGWLPLGGYVKIAGMIDESMDKDQMKQEPQPWEFRTKPAWQRLIVMLGGVTVNAILAVIIFAGVLFTYGEQFLPNSSVKYGVAADSLARIMGIQDGDKIVSVNEIPIEKFTDITSEIVLNKATTLTVDRNSTLIPIEVKGSDVKALIDNKMTGFVSPRFPTEIAEVVKKSVAQKAGVQVGDKPLTINGESVAFAHELSKVVKLNAGKPIDYIALRGADTVKISMTVPVEGAIGIRMNADITKFFEVSTSEYTMGEAIVGGYSKATNTLDKYISQFKLIFDKDVQGYKQMGGFISMGSIFPDTWGDWQSFWIMTGLLSIVLAFMNLLPIPALDGGHVLFTLYEMITRRKPNEKFLEYAQTAGMILLLSLMVYVNANDIVKLF